MTETYVLIAGFLLTFSFLGYKLAGLVKKTLDGYSKNIEMKINNAEMLKLKAIQMFDEATNRSKTIEREIETLQEKTNYKISEIKTKFEKETDKIISNIEKNNLSKIENETNEMIENVKQQITKCIEENIKTFTNDHISKEQQDNAMVKILTKVDFKKMFS